MGDLDFTTVTRADVMMAVIALRQSAKERRELAERAPTEQERKMLTGNADAFDRAADKFAILRKSL